MEGTLYVPNAHQSRVSNVRGRQRVRVGLLAAVGQLDAQPDPVSVLAHQVPSRLHPHTQVHMLLLQLLLSEEPPRRQQAHQLDHRHDH